jgi:hypothetical protein
VFENRLLRRTSGLKMKEITEAGEKLGFSHKGKNTD